MTFDEIVAKFPGARRHGDGKAMAPCPVHEADGAHHDPSLSISRGDEGKTLLCCQGGCESVGVLAAVGLSMRDLFESETAKPSGQWICRDYRDETGKVLFQSVRIPCPPPKRKTFRQRRPDPAGKNGWVWDLNGTRLVLYCLPELLASDPSSTVFVCEGEKDVDRLRSMGLTATTNPMGAGKWHLGKEYSEFLRGRNVAVLVDNDPPGKAHAEQVAQSLQGVAALVKTVLLPGLPVKGDVSDWLDAGHNVEELRAIVEATPEWAPQAEPVSVDVVEPDAVLPVGTAKCARDYAMTETGAGELFADRFRGPVAYVTGVGWLAWAKTHMRRDPDKIAVMEKTKIVAREFLDEAKWAADRDDVRAKAFARFGIGAQRVSFRRAVLDAAKSEPGIERDAAELDRDPMLFNVRNGTIDLTTGNLRPHNPNDLITRVVPIDFDPDAQCPRWERFLVEVLPDAETIGFVQRFAGYCLTGSVEEEVFVFCHGSGANGKTKLAETLKAMSGPYAVTGPKGMLMSRHGEHHECEMMPLMGARLVTFSELPPNQRFDSRALKSLTGGDEITARWICANPVTFAPSHKILVLANRKPDLDESDEAMRRRVRLVPFERTIPEADRDPHLAEKLRAELPGILAWAVRGCLAWQRDRLGQPAKVRAASDAYVAECDRLAPFFAEMVTFGPDLRVSCAALRTAYDGWCEREHEHPVGTREFAQRVRTLGGTQSSIRFGGAPVRGWLGVGLADRGPCVDVTEPLEKPGCDVCRPDLPEGSLAKSLVRDDRQMPTTDVYTSTGPSSGALSNDDVGEEIL